MFEQGLDVWIPFTKETTAVPRRQCQVCAGTQCDCDLHHPFGATSAGSIGASAAIWRQVGRSLALGFRILGDLRLLFIPPGAWVPLFVSLFSGWWDFIISTAFHRFLQKCFWVSQLFHLFAA